MTEESDNGQPPAVAIVGSGASGCYVAQFLKKLIPDARITVLERMAVPYGLIRYGVAPDHQGTKAISRQFDRLFEREGIRFAGNVDVGNQISLSDVRAAFDIVVLAVGLEAEREMGVPGEELDGVHRAGTLMRLLNGHPGVDLETINIGRRVVIVGNGNVSIDVLRMLLKSIPDFGGSDVDDDVLTEIRPEAVEVIDVVGRSSAEEAKFDAVNVRELAKIPGVRFQVVGLADEQDTDSSKLSALRELNRQCDGAHTTVTFRFGWKPAAVLGERVVCGMRFDASAAVGEQMEIACETVVTAIGFCETEGGPLAKTSLSKFNADPSVGRLDDGLFCTGWFRRGGRGTIPENRTDAKVVAEAIARAALEIRSDRRGFDGLPPGIVAASTTFEGWKAIDAEETRRGGTDRVRRKIRDWKALLELASHKAEDRRGDSP